MKEEFKPVKGIKERYSIEALAKDKGLTVDEFKEEIERFEEYKNKVLEKYKNKGMNDEQANRMTMLEIYIPGFTGPTFRNNY